MNKLILAMLEEKDEKKILKRAAFWNTIASIINSTLSSILLFFITRLSGLSAAGMFSIASAIAYQCLSLGNFGARNFHVSDVKKEYSFSDFFFVRVISSILMYGLLLYYAFGSGYTLEKAFVVLTFGIFKSIDAIEDLFHGEYHRNHRLDIAAVLLTFRYLISIISFIVLFIITKDLVITTAITSIITIIIFFVENMGTIRKFVFEKINFNFSKVRSLLYILIPICIANYVKIYVCNLPKYSIDANLNETMQTYFNILIMPVFIINLLSDVIFRPFITKLSIYWHNKDIVNFKNMIYKQLLIVLFLTVCMIIGGYIIGLRLLEIVYNVSLHNYMFSLIILLIAGGFNTAAGFLTLILTIQREQKKLVLAYILCTVFALIIANPLVIHFGILGASILYLLICALMFLIFIILVMIKNRRMIKGDKN